MLVYRCRQKPRPVPPRWPAHLVGATDLCRAESDHGDLVAICNPIHLAEPDADAQWHELPDDWAVCQVGGLDSESLARKVPPGPVLIVRDAQGNPWRVPAILTPEGGPALPLKFGSTGFDDVGGEKIPRWEHLPTPAQAAMLAAARAALSEIRAGRLDQLPLHIACGWMALFLSQTYHLSPAVIARLPILDNRLVSYGLLAVVGHPLPEGD